MISAGIILTQDGSVNASLSTSALEIFLDEIETSEGCASGNAAAAIHTKFSGANQYSSKHTIAAIKPTCVHSQIASTSKPSGYLSCMSFIASTIIQISAFIDVST